MTEYSDLIERLEAIAKGTSNLYPEERETIREAAEAVFRLMELEH